MFAFSTLDCRVLNILVLLDIIWISLLTRYYLNVQFWLDIIWISTRYRSGRYIRVTYKRKSRIIRRITRRFKIHLGRYWRYIVRRRGRLVLRFRRLYRPFKLTGGKLRVLYRGHWKLITRTPRRPRRKRVWRRRRKRRRRRRVRRRRRRYRRRQRRIRRRNVLRFKYGRKWIPAYRRGRYLRARIGRTWRIIRYDITIALTCYFCPYGQLLQRKTSGAKNSVKYEFQFGLGSYF